MITLITSNLAEIAETEAETEAVKSSQVRSLCVCYQPSKLLKVCRKKRETVRKTKGNLFASGVLILFSKFLLIQIKKCIKVVTKLMFKKTQHQLLKELSDFMIQTT